VTNNNAMRSVNKIDVEGSNQLSLVEQNGTEFIAGARFYSDDDTYIGRTSISNSNVFNINNSLDTTKEVKYMAFTITSSTNTSLKFAINKNASLEYEEFIPNSPSIEYPSEVKVCGSNGIINIVKSNGLEENDVNYQGKTHTITTQQPMLEGDTFVKVNDIWNEKHMWQKLILSELTWRLIEVTEGNLFRVLLSTAKSVEHIVKCNVFETIKNSVGRKNNNIYYNVNANTIDVICNEYISVEDFVQALSNANAYAYILLAEPIYIPCTEEQCMQLDEIEKSKNYKGETIIYSTDDISTSFRIKYRKDCAEHGGKALCTIVFFSSI